MPIAVGIAAFFFLGIICLCLFVDKKIKTFYYTFVPLACLYINITICVSCKESYDLITVKVKKIENIDVIPLNGDLRNANDLFNRSFKDEELVRISVPRKQRRGLFYITIGELKVVE